MPQLICHTLDLSTSSSCLESFVALAWWPVAPIPMPMPIRSSDAPFAIVAAGAYGNNHFARPMLAACDFVGKLRLMIVFSGLYNILWGCIYMYSRGVASDVPLFVCSSLTRQEADSNSISWQQQQPSL